MTEKRVSVRLAAVGGRQVRAELEGVGEAGARGFGRLSREMEAANTRLAAFARRARTGHPEPALDPPAPSSITSTRRAKDPPDQDHAGCSRSFDDGYPNYRSFMTHNLPDWPSCL